MPLTGAVGWGILPGVEGTAASHSPGRQTLTDEPAGTDNRCPPPPSSPRGDASFLFVPPRLAPAPCQSSVVLCVRSVGPTARCGRTQSNAEFDPGSGRTLAACLMHASRTQQACLAAWRTAEEHVGINPAVGDTSEKSETIPHTLARGKRQRAPGRACGPSGSW